MVPKIIFLLLKWTSASESPNLVATSLKDASFDIGMEEGIGVFVLLGTLSYKISEYLMYTHFSKKIAREQRQEKLLTQEVVQKIDTYSISKSLRTKLKTIYVLRNY